MEHQATSGTIYIPLQTVAHLVNLSPSSIRRLEIIGEFPKKRKLSARRIGYVLAEVTAWAENRAKA